MQSLPTEYTVPLPIVINIFIRLEKAIPKPCPEANRNNTSLAGGQPISRWLKPEKPTVTKTAVIPVKNQSSYQAGLVALTKGT